MPDGAPPAPDDARTPFSVDLSTGKAPTRRKRKGPPPVVQQTINLSTPKPPKDEAPVASPTPPAAKSRSNGGRGRGSASSPGRRNERPAPRSGNSLADLLDAETLARLRGEG